jgi:predicted amidohydrolase
VRVAVAQLRSSLDLPANRERAVAAVAAAAGQGAELVVLPEATQCGFGPPDLDLAARAEPLDGPFVTALAGAAREHRVTVVGGMFEAGAGGGRVFNTLVAVGPEGLAARYRKLHLYDALGWRESDRVRPGQPADDDNGPGVVTVPLGPFRLGLMTCYDLRFPEMARALVDAGATVLVLPAAWVAGEHKAEQWGVLVRARAIENTAYVVAAAQPGPEYTGYSMVVDPAGLHLAVLDAEEEGPRALGLADLDPERLDEVRQGMPVLANRRFAVVPAVKPAPATPAADPGP